MSYKQLTQSQRYVICALNKRNYTQKEIAEEVGVHPSTISRELRRNKGQRGYRRKQSHRKAMRRRKGKAKTRITQEDWNLVESHLKKQWSPEQISGRLEKDGTLQISHQWIYEYIWEDKENGGKLHKNLRCRSKYRKSYGSKNRQGRLKNRTSIDDRPEKVEERDRLGDWEADTIIGKGHKGAMLTLVDRTARFTLMGHLPKKTAEATYKQQVRLLKEHKDRVHTITYDNGREFADHEQTAEELEASTYFAHPYSSWEKGTVENTNGLIRQYFPKEQKLKEVDQEEIQRVQDLLNNRPRKCLNWKTPQEVFFEP